MRGVRMRPKVRTVMIRRKFSFTRRLKGVDLKSGMGANWNGI
jgi:hypothetical protein